MKKLMVTAAAALCAAVGVADGISSDNIVGYNVVTLKKGYNMLAVNFQNVAAPAQGISIQELGFTLDAGLTGGTGPVAGDQIQVYDATAGEYTTYFLYNNTRQPANVKNGKWCTTASGNPVATTMLQNGSSFWYLKRGDDDATVSISGAVSMQPNQTIAIVSGYNMIGNAFPANFNPNALGQDYWKAAITAGAVGGTGPVAGDQLQVYDATIGEYTTYFLYNNTRQPANAKNGKWCTTASGNPAVDATAEVLPLGKGAWYLHRGSGFTLTAPTPVK